MAYGATKAGKFVVDDGILDQGKMKSKRIMKKAELIDNASRVLFPLTFALYNLYYWIHYSYWLTDSRLQKYLQRLHLWKKAPWDIA